VTDLSEYGIETQEAPPMAMPDRMGNLIPPQSIEAEACVLGAMMLDVQAVSLARRIVQTVDFYRPAHQVIFDALCYVMDSRKPVDLVIVRDELIRRKKLEEVGGIDYVVALAEGVPSIANVEYYAKIVRDKSLLRQAIVAARKLERDAYNPMAAAVEVIGSGQQALYDLARPMSSGDEAYLGEAARRVLANMEAELTHGKPVERRFSSGYPDIDRCIHGLRGGRMVTLAAKTKAGKSMFALNMAFHVAMQGGPVLYISGEMRTTELAERYLSMSAPVHGDSLKNPRNVRQEDLERIARAGEMLDPLPLRLVGRGLSLSEIGMMAREIGTKYSTPTALIVVDYLALMKLPAAKDTRIRVGEFTRGLKQLAMELGACVLLVSQLRRLTEDNAKPSLHDLKESGDIENDSDAVLLIHTPPGTPTVYGHDGQAALESWIRVAAARDGMATSWPKSGDDNPDTIRLRWQPWHMRFLPWCA
jgi:replicative DNA helicase